MSTDDTLMMGEMHRCILDGHCVYSCEQRTPAAPPSLRHVALHFWPVCTVICVVNVHISCIMGQRAKNETKESIWGSHIKPFKPVLLVRRDNIDLV